MKCDGLQLSDECRVPVLLLGRLRVHDPFSHSDVTESLLKTLASDLLENMASDLLLCNPPRTDTCRKD